MPSVLENQLRWSEHPWEREGHEWSPGQTAAGGEMLWWRGLLPRIATHLPAGHILEIGPGFGRWTQHLLSLCNHLTAVDLTERCIEHCRSRFASSRNLAAFVNDGESLAMVPDESVDFVFSFDSLVHAEAPVLRAYVHQLARKLKPGGSGFIHHSNLRAFAGANGTLPGWLTRKNWRGESMSARRFREFCAEAGLECTTQELINWISRSQKADRHKIAGTGLPLTDVLSTFCRPAELATPRPHTRIYLNPRFAEEWRQLVVLAALYGRRYTGGPGRPEDAPRQRPDLVTRLREGLARRADAAGSFIRDHANAARVRRHEPIINAVGDGHCPDCGDRLTGLRCAGCHTEYCRG